MFQSLYVCLSIFLYNQYKQSINASFGIELHSICFSADSQLLLFIYFVLSIRIGTVCTHLFILFTCAGLRSIQSTVRSGGFITSYACCRLSCRFQVVCSIGLLHPIVMSSMFLFTLICVWLVNLCFSSFFQAVSSVHLFTYQAYPYLPTSPLPI